MDIYISFLGYLDTHFTHTAALRVQSKVEQSSTFLYGPVYFAQKKAMNTVLSIRFEDSSYLGKAPAGE